MAKVGIYGDIHLCSRNYGSHKDYPQESIDIFRQITRIAEERKLTHLIGLGDFSYYRFNKLEYRLKVEDELAKQYMLTNGNRYEIKGNHDKASYGLTEYEFYLKKGLLKNTRKIDIEHARIHLVDYGTEEEPLEFSDVNKNIVLAHNYFNFPNTSMPNYGNVIMLDEKEEWFDADMIVCGHIHDFHMLKGMMRRGLTAKEILLMYMGAMTRPSYTENVTDIGRFLIIDTDSGDVEIALIEVELLPAEEVFLAEDISKEAKKINIEDVVSELMVSSNSSNFAEPEVLIRSIPNVPDKYKDKALQYLAEAFE